MVGLLRIYTRSLTVARVEVTQGERGGKTKRRTFPRQPGARYRRTGCAARIRFRYEWRRVSPRFARSRAAQPIQTRKQWTAITRTRRTARLRLRLWLRSDASRERENVLFVLVWLVLFSTCTRAFLGPFFLADKDHSDWTASRRQPDGTLRRPNLVAFLLTTNHRAFQTEASSI